MLEQDGPRQTVAFLRVWQLSKRLRAYREVLTEAWSDNTSYQRTSHGLRSATPRSVGQCGVSSAWVIRQFGWSFRRRARYCVGDVVFHGSGGSRSELHCWIEYGNASSTKRLVIDLTCDQFEPMRNRPVLCASYKSLIDDSIEYNALGRMRFRELQKDDVWARYQLLVMATKQPRPLDASVRSTSSEV